MGGGGAAHGLEVEGQEVPAGDVDEAVGEADGEAGKVGAGAEEGRGQDEVTCAFGFPEYEGRCEYAAADEQAEGFWGGQGDATPPRSRPMRTVMVRSTMAMLLS